MKYLIRLEEAAKLIACFWLSMREGLSPLLFLALLLAPDVSMVGYLINNRWGAYLYNFVHHQGVGLLVTVMGYLVNEPVLIFAGLILVAHSSMDRVFGFGLKYADDFKNTHLGRIGR